MGSELFFEIGYNLNGDKFNVRGNLNSDYYEEVIDAFLSGQIGTEADGSKANDLEEYCIKLSLDVRTDTISCESNTGNRCLRDGILLKFLSTLKS